MTIIAFQEMLSAMNLHAASAWDLECTGVIAYVIMLEMELPVALVCGDFIFIQRSSRSFSVWFLNKLGYKVVN